PHARLADVSCAGHMVAGDRNDIFQSAILDFLHDLPD
ncbi:MAG: alpha/beta hydrolase, partial [Pseudomonadota bacterium]